MLKRLIYILSFTISVYAQGQWTIYNTGNSGLPHNTIGSIAFDTNNIKWIGTNDGLAKFDGTNWIVYDTVNSLLPHNRVISMAVDRFNVLWIGTNGGGIAKFDGTNWTIYDTNNSPIRSNIVQAITIENNIVKWFCSTRGLAKFDDFNWTIYNTTNSGIPGNQTQCIIIEDTIKWMGTLNNGVAKYDNANWVNYTFQNSGLPSNNIFGITVDYLGNKWVATFFGGIAKFNSIANQWTVYNSTNSGLPSDNNFAIITQNHIKWIGGGGLAKFNDTSWTVFNTSNSPLPSNDVLELALDRTGRLWIGTDGGLAVYNTGIIGINNQNANIPQKFELGQNYPNPFNPNTIIEYKINKPEIVSLTVYDVTGKIIKILEQNKKRNIGIYKITFEGSSLPSAVYYYKLETKEYTETKKMVLIK